MRAVSKTHVINTLKETGNYKAKAVGQVIEKSVGFFEVDIEDPETLYAMVYQSHPQNRILTPLRSAKDHFYTLGEVADRMIENGWTFEDFMVEKIEGEYDLGFFGPMMPIYNNFDHTKANYVLLRPIGERSRYFCPQGLFYIEDGAHRSLVTAYLLKTKKIKFQKMTYFLIQPKQHKNWLERLKL